MYANFINDDIRKICEDSKYAQRKLGKKGAEKLFMRIREILAAETLADLMIYPPARCYGLSNDRKGQFAVSVVDGKRLIFRPVTPHVEVNLIDEVEILEIKDYH